MTEIIIVLAVIAPIAAWLTSMGKCIEEGYVILALLNVFFPVIGVFHGIGVWLGMTDSTRDE